jgi:hypothetical protein
MLVNSDVMRNHLISMTWWSLRDTVLDHPDIFRWVGTRRADPRRIRRATSRSTDLVIDGYPRSANTFATFAFFLAQGADARERLEVANHWHRPSQFLLAARWGVPALLVIRQPKAAVISAMIYRDTHDADYLLRRYIRFHERVMPVRSAILVADFAEVTTDFGRTIERVNEHYGCRFARFLHTPENVERVREMIREHGERLHGTSSPAWQPARTMPMPVQERESLKLAQEERFARPGLGTLRDRAAEIYARMLAA